MILRRIVVPLLFAFVVGATAGWYWLLHTESGARFVWQRVVDASDGALAAQSVEGDLASGLSLGEAEIIAGSAHTTLETLFFTIDVDVLPLAVTLEVLRVDNVGVKLSEVRDVPGDDAETTVTVPDIALPLQLTIDKANVNNVRIVRAGENTALVIDQVVFSVDWNERLQISDLQLAIAEPQLTIVGHISGSADKFDLALSVPKYGASLEASILELRSARITSFEVNYSEVAAYGNAVVNWNDELSVIGELVVPRANVTMLTDNWPPGHPLSAELVFEYSGDRVAVSNALVRVNGTDTSVAADGVVDLKSERVDAILDWTQLHWPVAAAEPWVRSDSGKINVQGTIEDWQVNGDLLLAAAGVEDGSLTMTGGGDSDSLAISIVEGRVLGGSLSGDVSWSWAIDDAWEAALDLGDIQLGALIPELPVTLGGHVDLAPHRIMANNLLLRHRDDRALVNGDVFSSAGLAFEMAVADIGRYVTDAAGAFSATGTLSLVNDDPFLRVSGRSDWLSYKDVEAFTVRVRELGSEDDALATEITASELVVAGAHLRDITTTLRAAPAQQSLGLSFDLGEIRAAIAMHGRFDHWDSPEEWRGEITRLDVGMREFEPVAIHAATDILLAKKRIRIEEFCLRATGDAVLCAEADWLSEQHLDVAANFARIPVDIANDFQETGFTFSQLLSGNIEWHRAIGERPTGVADIRLSAGRIRSDEQPDFGVITEQAGVFFEVVDGKLLSGRLSLPMPGTGNIGGSFEATDIAAGLSSKISGGIDANITDMGIAAAFTPLIDRASGMLLADIDFSGTLRDPRAVGSLDVNAGEMHYQPLGMILRDMEIQAEFDDERHIIVDGSFRAGEGTAEFQTSAAYAATGATGIQLRLRGDNLSVIDVPDVQAIADADFSLRYEHDALELGGTLNFPRMHVTPQNLVTASATESEDVVIVVGELPPQHSEASSALAVFGELSVALGPDVVVDLDVAEANVAGEAVFTWSGDPMPLANGRYDVSGDIRAFGQVLKIEEGGVRFANVPASDPYVRVRAERQIYGNSQVKRAGVLVDGRLPRPTIEAYTNPLTTEERALTLLVTGSDFDYESGAGAIDFGTYIAPRLFVSYGVGIFERDNVISARYDLTKGFGIKASSGQKDSGVDLIYSYEN